MISTLLNCNYLTVKKTWDGFNRSKWEPKSKGWEDCGGTPDDWQGVPGRHSWCSKEENLWGQQIHKCYKCGACKATEPTKYLWCYY